VNKARARDSARMMSGAKEPWLNAAAQVKASVKATAKLGLS